MGGEEYAYTTQFDDKSLYSETNLKNKLGQDFEALSKISSGSGGKDGFAKWSKMIANEQGKFDLKINGVKMGDDDYDKDINKLGSEKKQKVAEKRKEFFLELYKALEDPTTDFTKGRKSPDLKDELSFSSQQKWEAFAGTDPKKDEILKFRGALEDAAEGERKDLYKFFKNIGGSTKGSDRDEEEYTPNEKQIAAGFFADVAAKFNPEEDKTPILKKSDYITFEFLDKFKDICSGTEDADEKKMEEMMERERKKLSEQEDLTKESEKLNPKSFAKDDLDVQDELFEEEEPKYYLPDLYTFLSVNAKGLLEVADEYKSRIKQLGGDKKVEKPSEEDDDDRYGDKSKEISPVNDLKLKLERVNAAALRFLIAFAVSDLRTNYAKHYENIAPILKTNEEAAKLESNSQEGNQKTDNNQKANNNQTTNNAQTTNKTQASTSTQKATTTQTANKNQATTDKKDEKNKSSNPFQAKVCGFLSAFITNAQNQLKIHEKNISSLEGDKDVNLLHTDEKHSFIPSIIDECFPKDQSGDIKKDFYNGPRGILNKMSDTKNDNADEQVDDGENDKLVKDFLYSDKGYGLKFIKDVHFKLHDKRDEKRNISKKKLKGLGESKEKIGKLENSNRTAVKQRNESKERERERVEGIEDYNKGEMDEIEITVTNQLKGYREIFGKIIDNFKERLKSYQKNAKDKITEIDDSIDEFNNGYGKELKDTEGYIKKLEKSRNDIAIIAIKNQINIVLSKLNGIRFDNNDQERDEKALQEFVNIKEKIQKKIDEIDKTIDECRNYISKHEQLNEEIKEGERSINELEKEVNSNNSRNNLESAQGEKEVDIVAEDNQQMDESIAKLENMLRQEYSESDTNSDTNELEQANEENRVENSNNSANQNNNGIEIVVVQQRNEPNNFQEHYNYNGHQNNFRQKTNRNYNKRRINYRKPNYNNFYQNRKFQNNYYAK